MQGAGVPITLARPHRVLTSAGSDSSGDAVRQADLKTFTAHESACELLADDWPGPAASLSALTGKLAETGTSPVVLGKAELGTAADHFTWMRKPERVAQTLAASHT